MNSPFANIFLATQLRIATGLSAIQYIDQDLGQLNGKNRPPVSWPCVLIDFEDFSFDNLGDNVQLAEGVVVFRLGFDSHSASSQATPSATIQQALGYYDIEWSLHKSLQGWSPGTDVGSFCRVSAHTQSRTDGYRVRELRYTLSFQDYSAKPSRLFAPAALVVTEQLSIPRP